MARGNLLGDLLRQVSRSFYLSLAVLPRPLRAPVGVAYLLARAADTIADTRLVSPAGRLEHLEAFRAELDGEALSRLTKIVEACTGANPHAGERELIRRLADCFVLYRQQAGADRERIRVLLLTITEGMIWDLERFPGEDQRDLVALESRAELDRYTYYMAGCVGEFWTEIHVAHLPRLARWNVEEMKGKGVSFGKGLQMTNILRDLARDLRRGRCYLPRPDLERLGLAPRDLLDPGAVGSLRPLISELVGVTLGHYEKGWRYTLAIPRAEWRMRLACAWPLLIGLRTLALIARAPNLLDPSAALKISRARVYGLMAGSLATVWSNVALGADLRQMRRLADPRGRR